ncbi:MAG: glycosyltransferase, partial [Longispora sp.]|nr:glycosyltransferase [Longispora sp. (in: high G+C Gram-positive bacteria)]
ASRPDVDYLGSRDGAGVREEMRNAAALVVASTWHDVLPTVIIEALAIGRPVLGTNLGGIPHLIGDAGWAVEPEVEALADGMVRAVGESGSVRESGSVDESAIPSAELRKRARQRYVENFTPAVVLDRLIEVYEKVRR